MRGSACVSNLDWLPLIVILVEVRSLPESTTLVQTPRSDACPCAAACAAAGCADPCCPCIPTTCVVRPRCGAQSTRPQYLLFTRSTFQVNDPSTHTSAFLEAVPNGIGARASKSNNLYIGNELIFSLFNSKPVDVQTALAAVLAASNESGVPVSLVLDSENWWGARPDLWNWFDPGAPGFSPQNVDNVERFGPTSESAVKIGWRDWGSQIRVQPQQNVLSPTVLKAMQTELHAAAATIAAWYSSLPSSRRYLLASVKVGWEAGLQYNAYYYEDGNSRVGQNASLDPNFRMNFSKGVGGGLPVLGYAAASSPMAKRAGISLKPNQTLDRDTIAAITRVYVDLLVNITIEAGVPAELIVNHVGGQNPVPESEPMEPVIPYSAGFSSSGVPGYSWYWGPPGPSFLSAMAATNRSRWAAAEWNLRGSTQEAWYSGFTRTLNVLDCAHIAVYNWDDDFSKEESGQAAVRQILQEW